jgi:hypothetical protein
MIAFPEVQRRAQKRKSTPWSDAAAVSRPTFADTVPLIFHTCARKAAQNDQRKFFIAVATVFDASRCKRRKTGSTKARIFRKGTVCISNLWHCNYDLTVFGEDTDEDSG